MKVKNLMFGGFAAAIFAGVIGDANAATYNLASKGYVDTEVAKVEAEVAKKQDTLTAGTGVTITKADDGTTTIDTKPIQVDGIDAPIETVVKDVVDVIGDTTDLGENETVIGKLSDVENTIGEIAEDTTVAAELAKKEDVVNKVQTATAEEIEAMKTEDKQTKYPSIAVAQTIANAAVTKVNEVAGDLGELQTQVETNTADINGIKEGAVMTSGITSGLVAKIGTNESAIADLQAADTALGGRVDTLEGTVGDAESGLVKDVADLKQADTDLGGRVDTLETNVGNTPVSDQIDTKINALKLPDTYDAKGAAEAVQTAVTEAKYVSAKDLGLGGYLVKSDGQGNVTMLDVAIVNGDGTKDMITDTDLAVTVE